ncbi:phosphoenolpyruvate synthase [Candidatus Acetothermia bacterium]|jgi:pyruvate,water dikinase|nr:phosphoenolpyruvate synthase [Candidatus Acetothermia bacterium]MCI2432204.1 phosphoenolpyruvate synthase [Candidatus Acetothermia bacterium]MCI2436107.1 phosphoenolpyruvate synthase [Candidatus Acetothermia bacterium]
MKDVLWLDEIKCSDVHSVGGKAASLGELRWALPEIPVPDGFVITAEAYRAFMNETGLARRVHALLQELDPHDLSALAKQGQKMRELITQTAFSSELETEIRAAYRVLLQRSESLSVAVRSSATTEDSQENSFAGQHDTFLNVQGEEQLLESVKRCFASLFTDRAISYRYDRGLTEEDLALAVVVQQMVRSDLASSGVLFTLDPESGLTNVLYLTAAYGFGELVVQGRVNPDQFYIFKAALSDGYRPIIERRLGSKEIKLVCDGEDRLKEVPVRAAEQRAFSLSDDEVLQLARWGVRIEEHYGRPMDIEWAKDGLSGRLFIVQARPETVHRAQGLHILESYVLEQRGELAVRGEPVGSKIGQGKAHIIQNVREIKTFQPGEVLVTQMTDPDWEPIMKIASAIVTERGGRTCHAAIISRELGIPCVIGAEGATQKIKTGQEITVDCSQGAGQVFRGKLRYRVDKINLESLPRTRTQIMMNVGIPEMAFAQAQIPNDGVGLAREEFIISSHIGIHPKALLEYEHLKARAAHDPQVAQIIKQIDERTVGYPDKAQFFVEVLASGVAVIAAAFWPNDVIVRLSDFKSNEYASLIGGVLYEPTESNPMIGWRGASRYYDPKYREAFELECRALKKARDEWGLTNIKVMIPFCRTPEEGKNVIKTMAEFGLRPHENGLEVYVMCEIPSNVILAEEFAEIFDGFSIGSNDLTQLALGLDRDSELVAHIYDERNEAVKRLVKHVITVAHRKGRKIGICGQAPSDFPEFAEFLVECGIDSLSLNPDTVIKTRLLVAEKERTSLPTPTVLAVAAGC